MKIRLCPECQNELSDMYGVDGPTWRDVKEHFNSCKYCKRWAKSQGPRLDKEDREMRKMMLGVIAEAKENSRTSGNKRSRKDAAPETGDSGFNDGGSVIGVTGANGLKNTFLAQGAGDKLCLLKTEWKACCCNCRYLLTDYHHCTTTGQVNNKCVCGIPRGFICTAGLSEEGRVHSGWGEHGICEMHEPKEEKETLTLLDLHL